MRIRDKYVACYFTMVCYASLVSCEFTEIPAPSNQLITSSTFADNTTATAALTSIYTQILNTGPNLSYYIPLFTGYSSDEFTNYSSQLTFTQFYSNALNASTSTDVLRLWQNLYNLSYQTNAVIEGVQQSQTLNPKVKSQLLGEAKFTRAFLNFYITNLWGDVPIVKTTDYRINSNLTRSKSIDVYDFIVSDLKDAQTLLNEKYVDQTDTVETIDRVRPNKWTAAALLARAYLFKGEWQKAEEQATLVLNQTTYQLEPNLNDVFLKGSREAIWQIMTPQPNFLSTFEGLYFILTDGPTSGEYNCSTLSTNLLSSFEDQDIRKTLWVGSTTSGNNVYYFPFKYKIQYSTDPTEYSTIFRLAEIFLIRAEARINLQRIQEGTSDLNEIRKRAGLNGLNLTNREEALQAVLNERQKELFSEWGHRWFDLKRSGKINEVMPKITSEKGGVWNTNSQLYPIPQSEINSNPKLTQNQGY